MPDEQPKAAPAETYNESTGLTNVDDSVFLHEDEENAEPEDKGDEPKGDEPKGDEPGEDEPEDGDEPENKEEEPSKEGEEEESEEDPNSPKKPEKPEKLLAGKYKSEDDLKAALINLGIDPADYQTVSEMETAYKTAQATFTRLHQKEADKRKTEITTEELPTVEQLVKDANAKIDYAKTTNAAELGEATVKAVIETILPVLSKLKVDPENMANIIGEKITNQQQLMSRVSQEIADIEAKVPRLRTDKTFRDDFADFVAGQKMNGKYENLTESMKKFMGGKFEPQKPTKENKKDKKSAGALPDNSDGNGGKVKQGDEADEILGAFAEHQKKFG